MESSHCTTILSATSWVKTDNEVEDWEYGQEIEAPVKRVWSTSYKKTTLDTIFGSDPTDVSVSVTMAGLILVVMLNDWLNAIGYELGSNLN